MNEALPTAAIMARVVSLHPCDNSTAKAMGPKVLNTIHCAIEHLKASPKPKGGFLE